MRVIQARHRDIVRKSLAFMRTRHDASITVPDIAAHVACSPDHLCRIFRGVTGNGILQNLRDVRMEEARKLLLNTSLNVSEVAFAVGFESHSAFARLFRQATGTTPTLFREALQAAEEAPGAPPAGPPSGKGKVIVRDDFTSDRLSDWWQPLDGDWKPGAGCLEGRAAAHSRLRIATRLPDNFRVEFEIQTARDSARDPAILHISFDDPSGSAGHYCDIRLMRPGQGPGSLSIRFRTVSWNIEAVVEPGRWHRVRAELTDNRIAVFLNGKRVFAYRDIFPPAYSSRSRLVIGMSAPALRIRRFRLSDVGFLPLTLEIRQGDALFTSGLFEQARDFYERHLRAGISSEEEMELRYKIGLCLLRQGHSAQARDWMHSIMPLAKDPYWRRECDLVLLQLDATPGSLEAFLRHARMSSRDPILRDGIRPIITTYFHALRAAGFLGPALRVAQAWIAMESTPDLALRWKQRAANILKNTRRFAEAERQLRRLLLPIHREEIRSDALVSLCDIALMRGQIGEARRLIKMVRESGGEYLPKIWNDEQEAGCLRAEGMFLESVDLLLSFRARYPEAKDHIQTAEARAAELLCCIGKSGEARRIGELIRKEMPGGQLPCFGPFRDFMLAANLADRRYEKLAGILLPDARREDNELSLHGRNAVAAGILLELAGKRKEAVKAWGEASRRFPAERCYFWGTLARAFADGKPDVSRRSFRAKPDHLEDMQLSWSARSEMFYFSGLLHEHRGDAPGARRLFTMALREDPTLRWPALLSKRELALSNH